MTTRIKGELEIDHERGVIYFHTTNLRLAQKMKGVTLLRICSLPTPIPNDRQLDITHMQSTSWGANEEEPE